MGNPTVAALAVDRRLLYIAQELLRAPATPFRATLFEKSGKANWLVAWHQDTALPLTARFDAPGWGPWSEKAGILYAHAPAWALSRVLAIRIHLDASTSDNGPLRVIPGSHAEGVLTDAQVLDHARARASAECLVPRGGALAMAPMIVHSSSKARTADPRRVLHIEYANSLDLAPGVRLAVA
jgi:ectoine hydroxylase-related dioxygenase (phytanoyl-CoA dioxygenase family)